MNVPDEVTALLRRFAAELPPLAPLVGLYVGGSVANGDYAPASSDLDAVAVVARRLTGEERASLGMLHRRLVSEVPAAAKLHCAYVPTDAAADLAAEHWTWAHGELLARRVTAIARAEILTSGVRLAGPDAAEVLPHVTDADVRAAAVGELTGYWARVLRKPWLWRQDVYVDIGLTSVARADATVREGRLISKTEAILRLRDLGVAPDLVAGIAARRAGRPTPLRGIGRLRRGLRARAATARLWRGVVAAYESP